MTPLRTWTVPGEPSLTITIHRPAMTLRYDDGPEITLTPEQISTLHEKFEEADSFFETDDPEILS